MVNMFRILGLLIFGLSYAAAARSAGCNLKLNTEIEKNFPLILTNFSSVLDLTFPKKGNIHLARNEEIIFVCADKRNSFTFGTGNISVASCVEDNELKIGNTHLNFEDIQCKKTIRGDVIETRERCLSGRGRFFKIGYQVTRRQWIMLFAICYDTKEGNALFAVHQLHGEEIKYASKSNYRPTFSPQALPRSIPASVAYKKAYQKSVLNKLLGSATVAEKYINNNSFMARGHLSPDADFIFAPWQYSTYYYVNTAPQWQAVNGGNWKRIENSVRNFAESANRSLTIFTGTHGILELPDGNNNLREIYLTITKKIPVPKYIWKIVYDEDNQSAIVLIILNNPFIQRITGDDYLCESVCKSSGWMENYFENYEQGFVHCCTHHDFFDVVTTVPSLKVRHTLTNK